MASTSLPWRYFCSLETKKDRGLSAKKAKIHCPFSGSLIRLNTLARYYEPVSLRQFKNWQRIAGGDVKKVSPADSIMHLMTDYSAVLMMDQDLLLQEYCCGTEC